MLSSKQPHFSRHFVVFSTGHSMSLRTIFETAIEISDPAAQRTYIETACEGQSELFEKVSTMLANHGVNDSFLEQPPRLIGDSHPSGSSPATFWKNTEADEEDDPLEEYLAILNPSDETDSLGTLGHFEILQFIGQGGYAAVFKALDKKLQRVVAIKILSPRLSTTSSQRKRFARESLAVAGLNHENVVRVFSVFEEPVPYMVMEFVEGKTLHELIKLHGRMNLDQILDIGRQIAKGLAATHAKGLIHRDIKPSNIMVEDGPKRVVRITDFGIARAVEDPSLTKSGLILGTPMYMSPEQANGALLDSRTDLFSFGAVLYMLATGNSPFQGSNMVSVIRLVADQSPVSICKLNSVIPEWLDAVIAKLLAKKPEDRFQSASELADLLDFCHSDWTTHGQILSPELLKVLSNITSESPGPKPLKNQLNYRLARHSHRYRKEALLVTGLCVALLVGLAGKYGAGISWSNPNSLLANLQPKAVETQVENKPVWSGWRPEKPAPAVAPFDATTARKHQKAWADFLKLPIDYTNSIGMKFILIPPGEFMMGSLPTDIYFALEKNIPEDVRGTELIKSERPQHLVILTNPIYVGIHEVTRQHYKTVMGALAENEIDQNIQNLIQNYPMDRINYYDALDFCQKLSHIEGRTPRYDVNGKSVSFISGTGYRLPTESEWEYFARAGTTGEFWTGSLSDGLDGAAWYDKSSNLRLHDVGLLRPNPFGIYDVHGNVSEITQDTWSLDSYQRYLSQPAVNPTGNTFNGKDIVYRGGRCTSYLYHCRVSMRDVTADPSIRYSQNGFRVVLPVDSETIITNLRSTQGGEIRKDSK